MKDASEDGALMSAQSSYQRTTSENQLDQA